MFRMLDGFGFEFSDEGLPPPERSEQEELEEQAREDEELGIGGFSAHYDALNEFADEYAGLDD